MNKTYQLKTNAIKGEQQVIDVKPALGKAPVKVTAASGARYELIDTSTKAAPDNIRVMRKGANLQIYFDGETEPGAVIENFYQAHADEQPTLVGTTEQGKLYEYIPESAAPSAVVAHLGDTGYSYGMALGGVELAAASGAGAAVAVVPLLAAFNPLLLGAGALGLAAAAAGGGGGGNGASGSNSTSPDPNPVTNTGEKTAISLNPVTGDNIINTAENAGNIALTGKVSGYFAENDIVTVYINGKSYTGIASADGSFSINVPASDLATDKDTKIEAKVTGTGGDTANAAQDYVVDNATNAGKQTALSIDPITQDNLINASEANGTINITGKVTGAFATTDIVTLTINGKTFTGTPGTDGRFSIPVSAADLVSDTDTTVEGVVGTVANAIQNFAVDRSPPSNESLSIKISTDKSNDGAVNETELNGNEQFTSHIEPKGQVGDKVIIEANYSGGAQPAIKSIERILTSSDIKSGFDISFAAPDDGQTQTVTARYVDAFGNAASGAAATDSARRDTTLPTIEVTSKLTVLKKGDTANITFTLSESSSDFTAADITFTGGTLSNFTGSGTSYTAKFTPDDGLNIGSIKVDSGKFSDSAGNLNADGSDTNNSVTLSYDFTLPTIAIESKVASLKKGETATITFTLSEPSTDFSASDITCTGGQLSNFAGNGTTYTAIFTPDDGINNGSALIKVESSKFSDAAGNFNADGAETNNVLKLAYDTAAPTQTAQVTTIIDDTKPSILPDNNPNTYQGIVANGGVTNDRNLQVSGKLSAALDASDTVLVYDGGTRLGEATVTGLDWSFVDNRVLNHGQKISYTAIVSDTAGNQSTEGTAYKAEIDISPMSFSDLTSRFENGSNPFNLEQGPNNAPSVVFKLKGGADLEAGTYKLHLGSQTYNQTSLDGHLDIKINSPVSNIQAKDIYLEFWDVAGNYSAAYLKSATDTSIYNIPANIQFVV